MEGLVVVEGLVLLSVLAGFVEVEGLVLLSVLAGFVVVEGLVLLFVLAGCSLVEGRVGISRVEGVVGFDLSPLPCPLSFHCPFSLVCQPLSVFL